MEEIWKDIKGYEGLYQISSFGRVKKTRNKEKIMKGRIRGKGYLAVTLLDKHGEQKDFYIHRLVAEAFIPNLDNLPQVNHKSEIKTDNNVENLEWCDNLYNVNYGTRTKRSAESNMGHSRKGSGKRTKIYQYSMDGRLVKVWNSLLEIYDELGIFRSCIYKCCHGVYNQSHGFIWSYKKLEGDLTPSNSEAISP